MRKLKLKRKAKKVKRKILTVKPLAVRNTRDRFRPHQFKRELIQPTPLPTQPTVPTPYVKPPDMSDTPPTGDYTFDVQP